MNSNAEKSDETPSQVKGEGVRRIGAPNVTQGPVVRFAKDTNDIERMIKLGRSMHAESIAHDIPFSEERLRQLGVNALLDGSGYCLLLIESEADLQGFLVGQAGPHLFSDAIGATCSLFYVQPRYRGGLSAVKLLHAFRRWAVVQGAVRLYVPIASGVRLAQTDRFLSRLGFQLSGGNYCASAKI